MINIKKPTTVKIDFKNWDDAYLTKDAIKETHYCPICNKKSVDYIIQIYKDNSIDIADMDTKWYFVEHFELGLKLIIETMKNDGNFDVEFKLSNKEIKKIIKKFNTDYLNKYDNYKCEGIDCIPAFCSKKCFKIFILKNLKILNKLKQG